MKNLILTAFAVTFSLFTYSQIAQGGEPSNWEIKSLDSEINFVKTAILDMTSIEAEDAVVDQYKETPYRYGIDQEVDYNFFEEATFSSLPNGDKIWKLGIHCPDAKSINFIFDQFDLPEGGELFVYNESRNEFIGSFTHANNKEYGSLAIGIVHSDKIVIEYREPVSVANQTLLNISTITHGYRAVVNKFETEKGPFGTSGSCNMNVNCPDAAPWQVEKRGIALILNNGSAWCTGSLINNTNEDGTPYFLTAAHCDGNENNWVMYFNHEYLGCSNSGSAATNQSISGGTQVASTSPSDAHLVELSSNVPESYNPYFNGWDRSGAAVPNAVGIHHPAGDVKKISFDDDALQKTAYLSSTTTTGGNHWRIDEWERNTTTEGGSSGSPLFDQNHRIIGQLHGGFASCTTSGTQDQDWYGAMHASWSTLDDFLAPGATGTLTLDGYDPFEVLAPLTTLSIKAFLEGPYNSGTQLMDDFLRQSGNIPFTEPFTSLGFTHVGGGGETTNAGLLGNSGNNSEVDWVFVEIRSGSVPTNVIATQSAMIQKDGDITTPTGAPLEFTNLSSSSFYVVVRHRNHFGFRSANTYSSGNIHSIDFTNPAIPLFGTDAMNSVGGARVMIAGEANLDGQVNSIDRNGFWRIQNGGTYQYLTSTADFDLNGAINSVDRNGFWRVNNSKIQQLD